MASPASGSALLRMGALASAGSALLGGVNDVFQPIPGFGALMFQTVAVVLAVFCLTQAVLVVAPRLRSKIVAAPCPAVLRDWLAHYWGVPLFGFLALATALLGMSAWLSQRYAAQGGFIEALTDPRTNLAQGQGIAFLPENLLKVAEAGDVENVRRFMDGGMKPTVRAQGQPVVFLLIARKGPEIEATLGLFLDHGLGLDTPVEVSGAATVKEQLTLVDIAVRYENREALAFLVGRGARAEARLLGALRLEASAGKEFASVAVPLVAKAAGLADAPRQAVRDDHPLRGLRLGMPRDEVTAIVRSLGYPSARTSASEVWRSTFGATDGGCADLKAGCVVAGFGGVDAGLTSYAFAKRYASRAEAKAAVDRLVRELGKPAVTFSFDGLLPHRVRWETHGGKVTVMGWGRPFPRERQDTSGRAEAWPVEVAMISDIRDLRNMGSPAAEVFLIRVPERDVIPDARVDRSPF